MGNHKLSGRQKLITVLLACPVLSICAALSAAPWRGAGTADEPYLIADANDLQAVGADPNYWDACFKLTGNIDLSGFAWSDSNIIGRCYSWNDPNNQAFSGIFDGNSHAISNLTLESDGGDIGLFGCVDGQQAQIREVTLINPSIVAPWDEGIVGSLVGHMDAGKIWRCGVEGSKVSGGQSAGGLVGISEGTIERCYTTGTVDNRPVAITESGGLVGANFGVISQCSSNCRVSGAHYRGGLAGENYGRILDSHASGDVTDGLSSEFPLVGGLVGGNRDMILRCYSTTLVGRGGLKGGWSGGAY